MAAAAAKLPVPTDVTLKTPEQWTLIGKSVKRLDTVDKLSGKQVFAIDVKLPNMLCAAIAQCPVFGGTLQSFNADKVKGMPGVHSVVAVGDNAVAVVADKWYLAKTALGSLPIVWNEGAGATTNSAQIDDLLKSGLDAKEAALGQRHGDIEAGLAGAAKKIEAVYGTPFLAHATMEPILSSRSRDDRQRSGLYHALCFSQRSANAVSASLPQSRHPTPAHSAPHAGVERKGRALYQNHRR